jgi:hypothetical protein
MKLSKTQKINRFLFMAGLCAVMFMLVPYVILGHDAAIVYHDQLDGELIAYILRAKHMFDGNMIPEFMGGVYKTALTPPAPAAVLLFRIFSAYTALVILQLAGSIVGYLGMYALSRYVTGNTVIAVAVGVIFAYLPFLPVYGLSQYGIPMLIFLIVRMNDRCDTGSTAAALVYGVIYALNSSLVLTGFGVLASVAVWLLCTAALNKKAFGRIVSVWLGMLLTYAAENLSLIMQTLGFSDTFTSHKTEYALIAEEYLSGFKDAVINGGQHSEDLHKYFLWLLAVEVLCGIIFFVRKNSGDRKVYYVMCICVAVNIAYSAAAAVWNGRLGVELRENVGVLGAFQLDRFMWIAPTLWYLALACGLSLLISAGDSLSKKRIVKFTSCGVSAVILGVCGMNVLKGSNLKPNLQKLINPSYEVISFKDYYAEGVMEQVESFIYETTGKTTDEYRVASLGIDPAAALYQGFYSIDGYSNNYSLEYKHDFRKIIAPELDKSEYLTAYFDEWGNRCYLFSAECPGYYMIEKGGFYFQNWEIDTEAFKSMGGEYIISAAYIADAERCGLKLLREEPFETEDSYYRLYLYGV